MMLSPSFDPRQGLRIIATDDNHNKLSAIVQTLRDAGHCVFAAYDGASAFELIVALPKVDILITNTRLGAIDGPELMRRTRQHHPGMPILHIVHDGDTGDGTPPDVPTLREPFTPAQMLRAVANLLT
jgi:CheY-like chemotaxis protein